MRTDRMRFYERAYEIDDVIKFFDKLRPVRGDTLACLI